MKSVHLPTIFFSIFGAALICTLFLGFSYLEAQWEGAPEAPPGGNIDAPIHTGGGAQYKNAGAGTAQPQPGDRIFTGQFVSLDKMRSDRYCDVNGNNCFGPNDVGNGGGGGGAGTDVDVYLCPELPGRAQGNGCTTNCTGQLSTQSTCTYQTETRTDCRTNTASCSLLGELMVVGPGGGGSSCSATTESLPSTTDGPFARCTYSLPAGNHSQVVTPRGDRGFVSTFQCSNGTWQVVNNGCNFSPGP